MAGAFEAGLTPAQFWRATPREIVAVRTGYYRRRGWQAWHGAMLGRCEARDFPSLAKLTGEAPRQRQMQDPEDMLAAIMGMVTVSPEHNAEA